MIHYTVRKSKRTRISYRIAAAIIVLVPMCQFYAFIKGYGRDKRVLLILCILLFLYGLYLLIHTFKKTMYDITYNFEDDCIRIEHVRGETKYDYADVNDVSLVTPDDANQYNIIHLVIGKEDFVIPFTYKKELCDKVYEHLLSHVTAAKLNEPEE